jgi:hypothetical protein
MSSLSETARTVMSLGLTSVARLLWYRAGMRLGLNPVRRLHAAPPRGPFFHDVSVGLPAVDAAPVTSWKTTGKLFGRWELPVSVEPPDWHLNTLDGVRVPEAHRPWWQIPDFDPAVGDIKVVWELSRMDWVLALAQHARLGEAAALDRLNSWLSDWCANNPPYLGPNWKCGQEASIRVMHLAAAALILGQEKTASEGLRELILVHLRRIAPTMQYAVAQDNNHGTSEAAALFIGGAWLELLGNSAGARWRAKGRAWLQDRVSHLVSRDGTFSQYSLNYHRLMLDTLSFAEVWRRRLDLPEFPLDYRQRASAAARWLQQLIMETNGFGPNVGANDGARLFPLAEVPYGDYRPSVQLGTVLFAEKCAYGKHGPWNDLPAWLGVLLPNARTPPVGSFSADIGGFATLRKASALVMMRYPRFRFRPSQADILHVDLWVGGENLLRDGGSYSYFTDEETWRYFSGTASHNTVQFDGRDQMPRLSRFLFGAWPRATLAAPLPITHDGTRFCSSYRDVSGATHRRSVLLQDGVLRVEDHVKDFTHKAVLRWRLAPGPWSLHDLCATNGLQTMRLSSDVPVTRCDLVIGWESRHYREKTPLPVIELEIRESGSVVSEFRWNN